LVIDRIDDPGHAPKVEENDHEPDCQKQNALKSARFVEIGRDADEAKLVVQSQVGWEMDTPFL